MVRNILWHSCFWPLPGPRQIINTYRVTEGLRIPGSPPGCPSRYQCATPFPSRDSTLPKKSNKELNIYATSFKVGVDSRLIRYGSRMRFARHSSPLGRQTEGVSYLLFFGLRSWAHRPGLDAASDPAVRGLWGC